MLAMICPNCQSNLQGVTRQDVQLEVCGNCRGVWLDREELEKLLGNFQAAEQKERHERRENAPTLGAATEQYPEREYQREHYNDPDRYHRFSGHPEKSAFERLGEIFK
jgi:Zn-finger nucleic acid-binding protein